jgi:hypothetical protein
MLEGEVRYHAPFPVNDNNRMVIFGPIETHIMRKVLPLFHRFGLCLHRGAVMRRSDTGSLLGYCSLRRWDGRRRAGR